jgi:hypothetical protein
MVQVPLGGIAGQSADGLRFNKHTILSFAVGFGFFLRLVFDRVDSITTTHYRKRPRAGYRTISPR